MIKLLWLKTVSAVNVMMEFCFVLVGLTSYQLVLFFGESVHNGNHPHPPVLEF